MSNNDHSAPTMYERIPAVAALNNVPGFDPVKLLRKTVSSKTKEPVLKLYLPYKKLWFRLLYPNGRIKLNRLRMTEQVAIYEAQVFLDRMDNEPISSFTACCTKEDSPNGRYLQDAQDEATDEALSAAGFGLQFADVSMTSQEKRFGSEIPVSQAGAIASNTAAAPATVVPASVNTRQAAPKQVTLPANTVKQAPIAEAMPNARTTVPGKTAVQRAGVNAQTGKAPVVNPSQGMAGTVNQNVAVPKAAPTVKPSAAPVTPPANVVNIPSNVKSQKPEAKPASETAKMSSAVQTAAPVQPAMRNEVPKVQTAPQATAEPPKMEGEPANVAQNAFAVLRGAYNAAPAESAPAVPTAPAAPTPSQKDIARTYTPQTPVEEIMKQMSLEEARGIHVETGTCAGMTLGEVADRRAPILRFYTGGGYKGKNNIFLAAAKIVQQSLELKKAG